jgi:hypothetical protein
MRQSGIRITFFLCVFSFCCWALTENEINTLNELQEVWEIPTWIGITNLFFIFIFLMNAANASDACTSWPGITCNGGSVQSMKSKTITADINFYLANCKT